MTASATSTGATSKQAPLPARRDALGSARVTTRRRHLSDRRGALASTVLYVVLIVATVLSLLPAFWVMVSSFKTAAQINTGEGFWPTPLTVQGYIDAFTQIHLQEYIFNSLLYAIGGTIGALVVAFLAAYPLARFDFRGKAFLNVTFALALAVPLVGLATPVFFIVRELGLFDSKIGLVILYAALQFPFTFVVLRSFLQSIPPELEEAAMMDGAGYFTILGRVVLPLSRPAIATVSVVAFVQIWNEFFFANLLTVSAENQSVQLALAAFKSQFGFNITGALAGATIVMLVPIILFLVLQRQVIEGLTAGAVKS
ncbi:carbohydrate ABC transporter permease [Agromyces ramosus]|uniref:Raffinose/stachyose/melibiose transport system permease protein n=1 Tax=Agromyces ramosus TaxID=33879 RepID=A0ABU0RAD8_9MICO|nr:carbohydrate ABC transporter permease [Agromyces ramosus]MDQ0895028.1 raffinose/stachyose/melibiose transport system permease protein [Agromyces ramosus]